MNNLKYNLRMYGSLITMAMRSMMQYRADFLTSLIGVFILNGANIIQMSVVAWKFDMLGTWNGGDLMTLYGLYMVSLSISSIFFSRISDLENEIVNGTFDKYLVRPMSAFLQFIGGEIRYVGLCDTFFGVLLISVGKSMNGIIWVWSDYLWLITFIICGGGIIICIKLMLSCASFWFVKSSSLTSMLTQILLLTQKYPIAIFGKFFKVFVTSVIPIAYMNYYPAVILLRKADEPLWLCAISPIILLLLVIATMRIWKSGVHRYGSAGG